MNKFLKIFTKPNMTTIITESLDSKRFECVVPPASKVYSFKMTLRSNQQNYGWGWTQKIKGGYLIFTDKLQKVKIVNTQKELKQELAEFYTICNRESLKLK